MLPDILNDAGIIIPAAKVLGQHEKEAAAHGKLGNIHMDNGD
jgi:hypothetical protein